MNLKGFITEKFQLTLKYHKTLNPKLWTLGATLQVGIRELLLTQALEFCTFSGISQDRIVDIVMTGGNTNYNYTKFSDIDVHILVDRMDASKDFLFDRKRQWSDMKKDFTIEHYPVEFYIQNDHEHIPEGQGVFSLSSNRWKVLPTHLKTVDILSDPKVLLKIEQYTHYIKTHLLRVGTREEITTFKERLHNMRQAGLERAGEFSFENVLYKELRNRQLVQRLNDRLQQIEPL
jgi:hypothetical protein